MQLYEQFRPSKWSEVVGQDKALAQIEQLRSRGFGGRAYWIAGQSGTGKTTIALLLAREIAEPLCIEEIDSTTVTPTKLSAIEDNMQTYGWGASKGKAYIINEAHGLRRDAIQQLLVLLERLPSHVIVIFTTTSEGNDKLFEEQIDAQPLLSRCQEIPLSRRDLAQAFAARAKQIAQSVGLDGQDDSKYLKLVRDCKNNMRAVLQAIEVGIMKNE